MLRPLSAILAMFALIEVGLDLIAGSTFSVDLWLGRMYWLSNMSLNGIPDMVASIFQLFPAFLLLFFILLLAVGVLSLMERD
jgi:hypothetical protein